MFSERLKLARKRSGLSLRDLSSNMNGMVSAQAIGKYERGEMMPSSSVAIALSNALDVTTTYLLSPTVVSLESVEFKKLASTKVRERAMVEAAVLDHVDRYLQVEELLGIASSIWEIPDGASYPAETVADGELIAARVRATWNLGGGPIPSMTELLEEHGIKVLKLDFPSTVDGLTCFVHRTDDTAVPVIVCSTGKSIERQRFTLAHELGHLIMNIPAGMPEEKICDRFASALLVPEDELVREVGHRRLDFGFGELVEIKKMFGVSAAALVVRMRDLGIIGEATVTRIFRGIGRSWRTQEPCPLAQPESPKRFRRLCLRALAEDVISKSKAAELLGMRVSEIERVMVGTAN